MNKKLEYVFIVNPIAGSQNADEVIERIHEVCRKHELKYRIIKTERPKHASEIVRKLPKTGKVIFAVGGDGTMNEVLQGMMKTNNVMGVIPNGTGNDFSASLAKIKDKEPKIDVGVLNHRQYFLNYVGMGFSTNVTVAASQKFRRKWIPKKARFPLSILHTVATFRPMKIKFTINGTTKEERSTIIVAANGSRFGLEYFIAPEADLRDGEMDICFVDAVSLPVLIPLINSVKTGEHVKNPNVHMRRTDHVKIQSEKHVSFDIDGELMTANKLDIKIIRGGVTIFNDQKFIREIVDDES
ncbi:MAG: diacylglycerol kinase family lipid kinase [Candidatus Nomurabacteria bacterium]|jgi:YegS/Rv2252/BmrU family lipid kinase|nr:diacylglycerol kinase family lipid kinase [Candidatus Nomurabacteria bacterium]